MCISLPLQCVSGGVDAPYRPSSTLQPIIVEQWSKRSTSVWMHSDHTCTLYLSYVYLYVCMYVYLYLSYVYLYVLYICISPMYIYMYACISVSMYISYSISETLQLPEEYTDAQKDWFTKPIRVSYNSYCKR